MKYLAVALAVAVSTPAHAAVFADTLVSSSNVTAFGSGLVTGSPDSGGLWLGSTFDPPADLGSLTVGFSSALIDGAGVDLKIYELASSSSETFNVFVSSDNVGFTLLGEFSATNNLIDFAGLFAGPVSYVRLTNTSNVASADIDAIEGYFLAGAVPEPSTWAMMLLGFGALAGALRYRRKERVRLSFS